MVHRPERLTDIFYNARKYKIEPKVMRLVLPYEGREPSLVLLELVKGGKAALKTEKNLVVYNSDNSYTDEVYNIYYN